MRLGYLGPEGTFGEEAARSYQRDATLVPKPTIAGAIAALLGGSLDRVLLPIDNVIAGPVGETLDQLYLHRDDIVIADMRLLTVNHALGSFGTQTSIEVIRSRDNTLAQCGQFLSEHYPSARREAVSSTSAAIRELAQSRDKAAAAIGNPLAMERYGLPVVAHNVSDSDNNRMRFVLLARHEEGLRAPTGRDATSLVLAPPADRVGILRDALQIISGNWGLSLMAMHSRPDGRGGLRFHLDVEGHMDDDTVAACVEELERALGDDRVGVHVLGCYPRCSFIEPKIKSIGIIGGTGAMGQWLKATFAHAGYDVLIAGRKTDLTYAECVAHSDVVLMNVPIRNTDEMISAVGPLLGKGQLLVDNTSIKTQPVAAMLKAAGAEVEVLGMHTVFGPEAASLHGQNVVFTRTDRSAALSEEFEHIFYKHGARITYTDCEHHDRQMAFHQNLEHFTKLVLAEVLCESFDDPDSLDRFSSPNSRASLATIGRVLHIDLDLLAQIQSWNLQGPDMIRKFIDVATRLGQAVEKNDMHALQKSVEKSAGQLGHRFLADMLARSRERDKT